MSTPKITISFPPIPTGWIGTTADFLRWITSNISFNIPPELTVSSDGSGPEITMDFPALPEGFRGSPDELMAWIRDNALISISGAFLNGQIGGAIDKTKDSGLFVDVGNRSIEAWNQESSSYITLGFPVGGMLQFPGVNLSEPPANFFFADGKSLSRSTYPELFAVIGTSYGHDSDTTFNLPDMTENVTTVSTTIPEGHPEDGVDLRWIIRYR